MAKKEQKRFKPDFLLYEKNNIPYPHQLGERATAMMDLTNQEVMNKPETRRIAVNILEGQVNAQKKLLKEVHAHHLKPKQKNGKQDLKCNVQNFKHYSIP